MLYVKLLGKELRHRVGLLIVSTIMFIVMFHLNGYTVGSMEYLYMLFALAACAVILSEDETDFLIMGRIQLPRVFIFRLIASVLCVSLVPSMWILVFTKERRPLKAVFAFVVTVLIIAAIGAFFRVLLKSTLGAMISSLVVFTVLLFISDFGHFTPFNSMTISDIRIFYLNRIVWLAVSALLLGICVVVLGLRDRYRGLRGYRK